MQTPKLVDAPIGRTLAKLAIPNIIAVTIQSSLSVVDAWFLGHLGQTALAGAALVFPIFMLAGMLSAGAIGGAVSGVAARAMGANDHTQAEAVLRAAIIIAIAGASLMSIVFLTLGRTIYAWIGGHGEVLNAAVSYSDVLLGGILFIWLSNMLSSVLRGIGDMITPAISLLLVSGVHIIAAAVLVGGWGSGNSLGIPGAAWAILVAYAAGVVVLLISLLRSSSRVKLKMGPIPWFVVAPILRNGLLASLQSIMTITIALTTTSLVGRLGTAWLAGYGIGIRLELLLVPIIFGFGGALIAMSGANLGAGKRQRAISIAWFGTFVCATIVGAIGIALSLMPEFWSATFSNEAQVIATCNHYLSIVAPWYGFFALGLCLYFASQGLNTLLVPILGTALRLFIIVFGGLAIVKWDLLSANSIFVLVAIAIIAYGIVISLSLHFGPWRQNVSAR